MNLQDVRLSILDFLLMKTKKVNYKVFDVENGDGSCNVDSFLLGDVLLLYTFLNLGIPL